MHRNRFWIGVMAALMLIFAATAQAAAPTAQKGGYSDAIVFASNADGDFDIYVANLVNGNVVPLTFNDSEDYSPVWSRDGKQIAFASDQDGDWDIYVMSYDGSSVTNLTDDNSSDDLYPAWSEDDEIAFTSNRSGSWDLWVMDASGRNPTQMTFADGYEGTPTWSPDGWLAYVSGRENAREIHALDRDGTSYTVIASGSGDYSPAWSPDGDYIAYVSRQDGNEEIYLLDTACIEAASCANSVLNLTQDSGGDVDPAWSPDSSQIVFGSGRNGSSTELYVMNMDGSGLAALTNDGTDHRFPAWWQH